MSDEVGLYGIVEIFVPVSGDSFKAEASARDAADGRARTVVVQTDRDTVADTLGVIVAAENEGEDDRAHIIDGVNGVHLGESFVEELTRADIIGDLAFVRKRPFEFFIELAVLGDLLHAFLDGIERCLCGERRRDSRRAEHFAVDTVFAVRQISIVIGELSRRFGIAGFRVTERVRADRRADPFHVAVEVRRAFGTGARLELFERFFLRGASVGENVEPKLSDIIQCIIFTVFFKQEHIEDDIGDVVVNGYLVDILKKIVGSLVDTVVDLFGIVRACPIIAGREFHAAFERDRLHIGNGIHFDGNAEHTSGEASDQSALHAGFEIFDRNGSRVCAFGTKCEDFVQFIGLVNVCVHVHKGLRSAVRDGFVFLLRQTAYFYFTI